MEDKRIEPNFLFKNGVFYGGFSAVKSMFVSDISPPQFFGGKCVKHAILTQTFPITFRFEIGTTFTLSQQRWWGGENPPIIQPKWHL